MFEQVFYKGSRGNFAAAAAAAAAFDSWVLELIALGVEAHFKLRLSLMSPACFPVWLA